MRLSFILPVLLGWLQLCAALQRVELKPDGSLEPRQILGGNCSSTDTCSECFGPGQVICQYIGCFDPSKHEQCCGDASYCVAANNSCCDEVGPGETGTDGVPSATAPFSLPFVSGTSFACTSSDSGEECCQRGGQNLHWCSGSFPDQFCYNPSAQEFCCANGVVCEYDGCCDLLNQATLTSPWTAAAASATAPPITTGYQASNVNVTPQPSRVGSSASASATTSTKSTNVAPNPLHSWDIFAGGAAVALAIAGVMLL